MEPSTNHRGGGLRRIGKFLWRAAATFATESDHVNHVRSTLADAVPMDGSWLTPSDLGLNLDGARSPAWCRTDLAVYAMRYQNGWGKAETERPDDGKVTTFKVVERNRSLEKAA